jgi:hypothetical protein
MKSPFPGMDPYLEDPAFWEDFHRRFIAHCADALSEQLPAAYEARIDERVRLVDASSEPERRVLPDIAVIRQPHARPGAAGSRGSGGGVATLEPVAIPMAVTAEVRDVWIEILHRPERSLVTVIELLSPSNKAGAGFGQYLEKRRAVLDRGAHLVELDLLVGGQRVPLLKPLPAGDYHAFVTRQDHLPYVDVYTWSVRDPLPAVPVPLRAPDPDLLLALGGLLGHTYERAHYAHSLRYAEPPRAPLSPVDAAWAQSLARPMLEHQQ